MFAKFTPKAIALGIISGLIMIAMAMGVEITKAQLFEIRKSIAALEESKASKTAADAQVLDAVNKLTGTLETARATDHVGQLQAGATIAAANRVAEATMTAATIAGKNLVEATRINMHPENEMYDSVTGPLFGEPSKRMAEINAQLVRLGHEIESGIDSTTGRQLLKVEQFNASLKKQKLQQELEILNATAKKNWQDATRMVFGAFTESVGAMGGLYPNGNEPPPVRRIVQEP